jgi:hypothetical protein
MLTEQYTIYALVTAPGSLPAARLLGWLAGTADRALEPVHLSLWAGHMSR